MRSLLLLSALILGPALGQPAAAAAPTIHDTNELDHALLWGRSIDQISAVMAVKLGFQVTPGRNPGGAANRYVRMADGSYLELEGITRADATMDPGMLADQAALHGGPGSRTFGLRSPILDAARTLLRDKGFAPTAVFSAAPDDPDGGGPTRPPRWRLFAFERQPLSSSLFLIDYTPAPASAAGATYARIAQQQPNGAQALSAVWLLSPNADADRRQLAKMGFTGATPLRLPQIGARGFCVAVGHKQVFALQPDGAGVAADALRRGGPQLLGVSIGVTDLVQAKHRVERGYEKTLASYPGPLGETFLAPTLDDLGMLVAFHALPTTCGR